MSTTPSTAPTALETKIQNALTGVQQVIPAGSTLQINGQAMTQAQLATQLSGYLPPFQTVLNEKQTYQAAVAARLAMEPGARAFLVQLRAALIALFGKGSQQLTKFGFGTGAHTAPTPTTQVVAAAKRQLTRAKRGTITKKQAAQITVVGQPTVELGGNGGVATKLAVTPQTVDATPARNTGSQSNASSASAGAPAASSASTPGPVAPVPAVVPSKS
jgi:hypothetical protein